MLTFACISEGGHDRTGTTDQELLRTIAHPARIKILEELTQSVKCVSDFEDLPETDAPMPVIE